MSLTTRSGAQWPSSNRHSRRLATSAPRSRLGYHARDAYVARLALDYRATREATRRPKKREKPADETTLPAFGQTWSFERRIGDRKRDAG